MTIEQTNKVDVIAINRFNGKVTLGITDHLDWDAIEDHLRLLQEKINTYLYFVESGQVYITYPDAKNRLFEIIHYTKYLMPDEGKLFIEQANEITNNLGINISTKLFDPESMI